MASNSKRIKLNSDILLEYIYDSTNYVSEDYKILTNLKENTKSFLSTSNLNNINNNLFLVDPLLDKYSILDTDKFNFLKIQNYASSIVLYDKLIIYLPSGYDFDDYLGFNLSVYTHGYDNNKIYGLSNFYYDKSNTDYIKIYDLPKPFLYDEKFWVRAIEIQIPSPDFVSKQRIVTNQLNEPKVNSINKNLTYGEGISINSPIFLEFRFITSSELVLETPYYYLENPYSITLPASPDFTEVGVEVIESTQGDYFEIYGTYMGSNENMDEFVYNEETKGNKIQLEYIVYLYEENILTTTQTYLVDKNFTNKILYRPVIQYSNTTAAIDVELRIVNLVDNSYQSKFGSLGLTKNLNKYGLRLSTINVNSNTFSPEIYNIKFNNMTNLSLGADGDGTDSIMRVPYPMLIDKYRILAKSQNTASPTSGYVPNGLLEIIITSFDTIINFTIAKDIYSNGYALPYNLTEITNNSKIVLAFKSDSEKVEKELFYEAGNNFEIGNIFFKIEEKDYNIIKKIYDKGYDNFYILIKSDSSNTQLYSGKYTFYEDVVFVDDENDSSTNQVEIATDDLLITDEASELIGENIDGFFNVLIYVKFTENIEKLDEYLQAIGIIPKIRYSNMYFLERVHGNYVVELEKLEYLEQVFRIPLNTGRIPKKLRKDKYDALNIYKNDGSTLRNNPTDKESVRVISPKLPDYNDPDSANDYIEKKVKNKRNGSR